MTTETELAALRERFAQILTGGQCARIAFHYGNVHIRGGGYCVIGMSLGTAPAHPHGRGEHRRMSVRVARLREHHGAEYRSRTNEIVVPRADYGVPLTERMAIVHEATHAVLDYYRTRLSAVDEEAVAYIACAMYIAMENRDYPAVSEVGRISMEIARGLTGATATLASWTDTVTQEQQDRLTQAIRESPAYAHIRRRPHMRYPHDGGRI
jgi:predicted ribosomally synthesized peptide with SipW-like signal peptide